MSNEITLDLEALLNSWIEAECNGVQFPVPFEAAWDIAGYTKKSNAKRALSALIDGEDFSSVMSKSNGGRDSEVFSLTCDAFKHFCIMAKTEKGRLIRTYFIEAEKKWKLVQQIAPQVASEVEKLAMPLTYIEALEAHIKSEKEKLVLAESNHKLLVAKQALELQAAKDAPKIDDYNRLLNTDGWMCVREVHKCLGLSTFKQKDLNAFLRDPEVKILSKDTNQPYSNWVEKKLAKMMPDRSPNGYPYNIPVFSYKGCIKILEALKKHGRIPVDHQCEFDFGFKVDRGQLAIAGSRN